MLICKHTAILFCPEIRLKEHFDMRMVAHTCKPNVGRQRQQNHNFGASLSYKVRSYSPG